MLSRPIAFQLNRKRKTLIRASPDRMRIEHRAIGPRGNETSKPRGKGKCARGANGIQLRDQLNGLFGLLEQSGNVKKVLPAPSPAGTAH
jgi:hypothetical protein